MAKYMLAYYGGDKPTSKEEGMEHMGKWKSWVESLGEAVINPGTPLRSSKLITSSSVVNDDSSNSMNGFAIIEAPTFEKAIEIANEDPFLKMNGTIRISEIMEMK